MSMIKHYLFNEINRLPSHYEGCSSGEGISDIISVADLRVLFGGVILGDGCSLLCPGPDHGADDRSMSITLDPSAPDGVLINSFSPGTSLSACKKYFWETIGPELRDALAEAKAKGKIGDGVATASAGRDDDKRAAYAGELWAHGSVTIEALAIDYLKSRRLSPLPDDVMRFRAWGKWEDEFSPELLLVARDIRSGSVRAVHRTRLPHIGASPQRKVNGPLRDAAIMLTPMADVLAVGELAISEGWESGLAAMALGKRNVWSVLNANGVKYFPVIEGIRRLVILGENNDANKKAREACAIRWFEAGREVAFAIPKKGDDFADYLMEVSR